MKDEHTLESPDVKVNEFDRPSPSFNENLKKSSMDKIEEQTFAENKSENKSVVEEKSPIQQTF